MRGAVHVHVHVRVYTCTYIHCVYVGNFHHGNVNSRNLLIQVLECPICNEQYGTEHSTTPRVLRCGHTYCTRCLQRLVNIHATTDSAGKRYGVKCAFCASLHELPRPDVELIPINHAVLEIIKISDSKKVENDKVKDVGPQCEYKGANCVGSANWVCFDCNPTTNTMFCEPCVKTEHERGFEPVARHRRMLMAQVSNPHTASCPYHPKNRATLYSVKLQQFACIECDTRPEFAEQKDLFELISDAVQRLRSQSKRMVTYSQEILARLNISLVSISANNSDLGPSVELTKNQIEEKFSEIREIILERQQTLMTHVQSEVCVCVCMCVCARPLCFVLSLQMPYSTHIPELCVTLYSCSGCLILDAMNGFT